MMSPELHKILYDQIPEDYVFEGKVFHCIKKYYNQYDWNKTPSILMQYRGFDSEDNPLIPTEAISNWQDDIIVYVSSVTVYPLLVSDIIEIVSVQAIVGGVLQTLNASLYQLVGNSIELLGPTLPDDKTRFVVKYKFKWARFKKGGYYKTDVVIDVLVSKEDYGKDVLLATHIAKELYKWMTLQMEIPGLAVAGMTGILDLDDTTVDIKLRRRQFTVTLRFSEYLYSYVETIETVTPPGVIVDAL